MRSPDFLSPYEQDIGDQVTAMADQLIYSLPGALRELDLARYERIVFTGMGSSHYATMPTERQWLRRGFPVWRIDSGSLLDFPELITRDTLLIITSQSGMSGEVVALLEKLLGARRPRTIIGVTNDEESVLACTCDILVALKSGHEATVSSKSYVNTLIAHHRMSLALLRQEEAPILAGLFAQKDSFSRLIANQSAALYITRNAFERGEPRLALIGVGADGATAMTGALILKEACKVNAEGYLSGEFRHGPVETSGPGMIALVIGDGTDVTLEALSNELVANGTEVVTIGPTAYAGSKLLQTVSGTELVRLISAMFYVQHLTVTLAHAKGLVPGDFSYGKKVTVAI